MRVCCECKAGGIKGPSVVLVELPNLNHPNLKIQKWVCNDHYTMLADDYPEIRIIAVKVNS